MAIKIMSAVYGTNKTAKNVTDKAQKLVNNGNDDITISNDNFGCDPDPGTTKIFGVIYMLETGEKRALCGLEGQTIDLIK